MALLERVATLLRANVAELLTKAEDPEKFAHQLILDMENQLMQVKTQVAIAIADQHNLLQKTNEQQNAAALWQREATAAVAKGHDNLARAALERALSHKRMEESLSEQLADQTAEADSLRKAYTRLQIKLQETKSQVDILAVRLRRTRDTQRGRGAQSTVQEGSRGANLTPPEREVGGERFTTPEQSDQIEALLLELKGRQTDRE